MQYDNKHLLDFREEVDVHWLKIGGNHTIWKQNRITCI